MENVSPRVEGRLGMLSVRINWEAVKIGLLAASMATIFMVIVFA